MNNIPQSAPNLTPPPDPQEVAEQAAATQAHDALAHAVNAQMAALDGLPPDLIGRIKNYIWRWQQLAETDARSARAVLGAKTPTLLSDPANGNRVFVGSVYDANDPLRAHAPEVLAGIEQRAHEAETTAQAEAQALVAEALQETVPPLPRGADVSQIPSLKADITAILEQEPAGDFRQVAAIDLIKQFVASSNLLALRVLLGPDMALTRQRLRLNDTTLLVAAFRQRLAAANNDPHAMTAPPHAVFLAQQLNPETHLGVVALRAASQARTSAAQSAKRLGLRTRR